MKGCRPWTSEEVERLAKSFKGRQARRNLVLFLVGIQTGRRISQMLSLRVRDVVDQKGQVRERVEFRRQFVKGKIEGQSILLNQRAREVLQPWVTHLIENSLAGQDSFLFMSERGLNKPISRRQAWYVIQQAVSALGLVGKQGTHSLRKTFANSVYNNLCKRLAAGDPVDPFRLTSKALGHKAINSTDAYLSFLEADVDQAIAAICE